MRRPGAPEFSKVDPRPNPHLEFAARDRAVSSAGEHCFHTAGVSGSIPLPPTIPSFQDVPQRPRSPRQAGFFVCWAFPGVARRGTRRFCRKGLDLPVPPAERATGTGSAGTRRPRSTCSLVHRHRSRGELASRRNLGRFGGVGPSAATTGRGTTSTARSGGPSRQHAATPGETCSANGDSFTKSLAGTARSSSRLAFARGAVKKRPTAGDRLVAYGYPHRSISSLGQVVIIHSDDKW